MGHRGIDTAVRRAVVGVPAGAGPGVIGQQPLLKPGESFEYSSGTHLETAVGTMRGTYQMIAEDGHTFEAPIPLFTLSVPRILH